MKRKYKLFYYCSFYLFLIHQIIQIKREVLITTLSSPPVTSAPLVTSRDWIGERDFKNVQENDKDEVSGFLQHQEILKSHIKSHCQKKFQGELPTFEKGFSSLVVDRVNNLTYCPIYKVASTSWGIALLKLRNEYNPKILNVRDMMDVVFKKVQHKTGPQETKDTVKFMLVRHPFERLISAYRDKFENATQKYFYQLYGESMVKRFRDIPQKMGSYKLGKLQREVSLFISNKRPISSGNPFANPIGPTFEEFVKFVLSYPTNDDHWRPYYIQCSLCHMDYHYVMRFENLANDSTNFLRVLNLSNNISINWDNPTAKGPTNDNIGCTYFQQISKNLAFKLFKKYEHDFKLFNYDPGTYFACSKPNL